jgi:hypothetical protein
MSKAKLVLSAIALFAMVGGAIAFKATRTVNMFYANRTFTTRTIPGGPIVTRTYCDEPFQTRYTTLPNFGLPITKAYSTTRLTVPCPVITVYSTL